MSQWYTPYGQPCTVEEASRFRANPKHHIVGRGILNDTEISTVYLGLDHSWLSDGPILIFESMIFGGPLGQFQQRYSTRAQAKAGHAALVERVKALRFLYSGELGYVAIDGGAILAKLEPYEAADPDEAATFGRALLAARIQAKETE